MYLPKHFEQNDIEALHGLIKQHPFGTLVTQTADGLEANHLPFLVHAEPEPYGTLHCHVARANPLWRNADSSAAALIVFQGPDRFITPSWYQSKAETGKAVPTWNYVVVHAYGSLKPIEDPLWLRAHLEALTNAHEGQRAEPWHVSDAPADYLDKMLTAIVGIEIPIRKLVGKWKLNQNKTPADREGVVRGLKADATLESLAMAELVEAALRNAKE